MLRVLVTGGRGQLGRELDEVLARHGEFVQHWAASSDELDITRGERLRAAVVDYAPDVIINAAAMTEVDRCEDDVDLAFKVNALGVRNLVESCRLVGAKLIHFSTDYVFDGEKNAPYTEWDATSPRSVYGASKLAGEKELRLEDLCIRTAWVVGRYGANMAKTVLRLAAAPGELRFVNDQIGSPTVASELAERTVDLMLSRRAGLFHITGQGKGSWYDFARVVIEAAGGDGDRVLPISTAELPGHRKAPRPKYSVLDNMVLRLSDLTLMDAWEDSVTRLVGWLTSST